MTIWVVVLYITFIYIYIHRFKHSISGADFISPLNKSHIWPVVSEEKNLAGFHGLLLREGRGGHGRELCLAPTYISPKLAPICTQFTKEWTVTAQHNFTSIVCQLGYRVMFLPVHTGQCSVSEHVSRAGSDGKTERADNWVIGSRAASRRAT